MNCKTCSFWVPRDDKALGGTCSCPKLDEDYGVYEPDMLVYSYNEGGYFWTGPEFGCVHHKEIA